MQTMNQSLATLYQKRLITLDAAMGASSMKDELEQMISRGAGVVPGAGMQRPGAPRPPLNSRAQQKPMTRPTINSVIGRRQLNRALSRRPNAAPTTAGMQK